MALPFGARVAYHRLRRHVDWLVRPQPWAHDGGNSGDFPIVVAQRSSPLKRAPTGAISAHTDEKTHNLRLATQRVTNCLIGPEQVLSFCRLVGKTTRRRGYLPALELREGALEACVGGGLCQLSNLLLLLAIDVNAEIVERHRHGLDLFRDVGRTVPFGCGATVFYNYVDFQFRNTLPFALLLEAYVAPPLLVARLRAREELPFRASIQETDHRFYREGGEIIRANRIWRHIEWEDGRPPSRELLFENACKVLYPADDLVEASADG